jgi:hypothetical protein
VSRQNVLKGLYTLGVVLLVVASHAAGGQSFGASWLDQPLQNWNRPRARIPKAPSGGIDAMCSDSVRKPVGPEDRAVTAAGWLLIGPLQTFSGTTFILAESSADGMCRPVGYQGFVFVGGRFAGTISPVSMNSRADGTMDPFDLNRADNLDITFSRYKESDPLCCASGQTLVTYSIKSVKGWPLLVPFSLHTFPRPKN